MNKIYYTVSHDLEQIGEIQEMVAKEYENFFQKKREANESFSISDLTDCIIAGLSKIKDDEH